MSEREKLQVLLERVKAASGPDREMDAAVWLALEPGVTRKQWSYIHTASGQECRMDETRDATGRLIVVPSFTASIDAALALVERVLPGWFGKVSFNGRGSFCWLWEPGVLDDDDDGKPIYGKTPALAILAALLTALAASKENTDG